MLGVIATIPVGGWPYDVAIHPDGARAYVANESIGMVSAIDTAAKIVTAAFGLAVPDVNPIDLVVHPNGTRLYVAHQGGVSVIDTSTNAVISFIAPFGVNDWPVLTIPPDGTRLYAAWPATDSVTVIDTATESITATISVGDTPWKSAVSPDGTRVYVANA